MSFTSIDFLLFCIPTVFIYWRLHHKYQNLFLLVASYIFICAGNYWFGISLGITTLVTYGCSRMIADNRFKKISFSVSMFFLFGQLVYAKYLGLFGIHGIQIIVPLGLSFYTFQTAGYLIDIYTGKSTAEKRIDRFALFVAFFPTLIAGPIERGEHLLPQMNTRHTFEYRRVVSGLELFTLGLFKKLVIADNLGTIVDKVFTSLHLYRGLSLVVAVLFFSWQLYYDFSGYSDMARGVAQILGFDVLINFKTPYLATSVQDFWRRWHISLSSWFRDYLYFPLGGNRKGLLRTIINICIVFTLCGLWHGAAMTFIIWGALHGTLMAIERIGKILTKERVQIPKFFSTAYTYFAVSFTWIFFRSSTVDDARYILQNSLTGITNFIHPSYVLATMSQLFTTNKVEMSIVGMLFVVGVFLEFFTYRYGQKNVIAKFPIGVRFVVYTLLVASILLLRQAKITQFIYIQF